MRLPVSPSRRHSTILRYQTEHGPETARPGPQNALSSIRTGPVGHSIPATVNACEALLSLLKPCFAPRYGIAGRAPFLGGSLTGHVRSAGG